MILLSVDKQLMVRSEEQTKEEFLMMSPNLLMCSKIGLNVVKLVLNSFVEAELACKQAHTVLHMKIFAYKIAKDEFIRLTISFFFCYEPENHLTCFRVLSSA